MKFKARKFPAVMDLSLENNKEIVLKETVLISNNSEKEDFDIDSFILFNLKLYSVFLLILVIIYYFLN